MNVLEVAGKQFRAGKTHTAEQRDAIWKSVDSARDEAVEPLRREAAKFIKRMGADVVETLNHLSRKAEHDFTIEELLLALDIDLWERDLRAQIEPLLASIIAAGFTIGAARVLFTGVFDGTTAPAATALANSVSQIVTVPGTFFDSISTVIKNGLDSNASLANIIRDIRGVTGSLSASQAERIARTSGGGSFEAGQQLAYLDAGITKHAWLSSRDARVRDSHVFMDGEEVEIGEPFSNGLLYPLDPAGAASEVINCRCTAEPIIEEDKSKIGAAWYKAAKGERGARGVPGIPGRAGASVRGERGEDGTDGVPGVDGRDGEPGKDGKAGKPGKVGVAGKLGKQGEKGVRGDGWWSGEGPPGESVGERGDFYLDEKNHAYWGPKKRNWRGTGPHRIVGSRGSDGVGAADTLTTLGDLLTHNGTDGVRLGVGADTQVLIADSGEALGVKWGAAGTGDVTKVGTPVDNEIGVWTGDGTLEGDADFTWDATTLKITDGADFVEVTPGGTPELRMFNSGIRDIKITALTSLTVDTGVDATGIVSATAGLVTGASKTNAGAGVVMMRPAGGTDAFLLWVEDTVAFRGMLGFSATSADLVYESGGAGTLGSGTERFRITGDSLVLGGDIELGHATDTTFARVSAGLASIEGSNIIMASNKLDALSATTSAELRTVISDDTGTGGLVFATSPTLVTPVLGTPSSGALGSCTAYEGTAVASTGEAGAVKFLREDGDGTSSWQTPSGSGDVTAAANLGDNLLIRGDGVSKGVQNSGVVLDDTDNVTGVTTLTVDGDTSAGDPATLGYTSVEGAILTGQGSTNDVTLKNDADDNVLVIPTGTQSVEINSTNTAGTTHSLSLVPTGVLGADAIWHGVHIDGAALDPSGTGAEIVAAEIDFSGVSETNDPILRGLEVTMPFGSDALHIEEGIVHVDTIVPSTVASEFSCIEVLINATDLAATSDVHGIDITNIGGGSGDVVGLLARTNVAPIHHETGTFSTPSQTEFAGRRTGGGLTWVDGIDTVEFFVANSDEVLIGSTTTFAQIEIIMSSDANKDTRPTFHYNTAADTWTEFFPSDGTEGFQKSGFVTWELGSISGSWTNDGDPGAGDTSAGFWIRIIRTRVADPGTPTATTMKTGDITELSWSKDGVITGLTLEATGDTSAGDNAAMGYTASEGLILTGQGSTDDVTIKNDADTTVLRVPTGTTGVTFAGVITATDAALTTPALGTPSAIVLTNATGSAAGIDSDATTHAAADGSSHLFIDQSVIAGAAPAFTSAVLTTPVLGTPSSGALGSCTAYEGTAMASTGEAGASKFLREDGDGTCSWQSPAGGGDVVGDTASVDKELVRFNGTGGKTIESPNTDLATTTATLSDNADLTLYDAVNAGNPVFAFGSSAAERLRVVPVFDGGAVTLDRVDFITDVVSGTADKGLFRFSPDGVAVLDIDDGGIEVTGAITVSGLVDGIDVGVDVAANTTHRSSDGSDHSFIDQDVTSGSGPAFTSATLTTPALGTPSAGVLSSCTEATTSAKGVVELATTAEIDTGTDTVRPMCADQYQASVRNLHMVQALLINGTTDVAVETDVSDWFWVAPYAGVFVQDDSNKNFFMAETKTAGTTGTMVVDLHLNGTTIMTTNKLDIETTETGTDTAATQPDLTTTAFVAGDIVTCDIDTVHTTAAKGLAINFAVRPT